MLGVWPSLSGFRQTYFASVFSRSFFYAMPLLFVPKGRGFFVENLFKLRQRRLNILYCLILNFKTVLWAVYS